MTNKPRWIPGPPTQPGWCWLKVKFCYEECGFITLIEYFDSDDLDIEKSQICGQEDCFNRDEILAHSPIQEPEE